MIQAVIDIGVDFDGTIVKHAFPSIGEIVPYAKEVLLELKKMGHHLHLNTMRSGVYLDEAVNFLKANDMFVFDGINVNPTQHTWATSPKVYANVYIDDAALGCPLKHDEWHPYVDWLLVRKWFVDHGYLLCDFTIATKTHKVIPITPMTLDERIRKGFKSLHTELQCSGIDYLLQAINHDWWHVNNILPLSTRTAVYENSTSGVEQTVKVEHWVHRKLRFTESQLEEFLQLDDASISKVFLAEMHCLLPVVNKHLIELHQLSILNEILKESNETDGITVNSWLATWNANGTTTRSKKDFSTTITYPFAPLVFDLDQEFDSCAKTYTLTLTLNYQPVYQS